MFTECIFASKVAQGNVYTIPLPHISLLRIKEIMKIYGYSDCILTLSKVRQWHCGIAWLEYILIVKEHCVFVRL